LQRVCIYFITKISRDQASRDTVSFLQGFTSQREESSPLAPVSWMSHEKTSPLQQHA
jgi:hypothetical protein